MIKYIFFPKIHINLNFKKLNFAKLNYILMVIENFHYKDITIYTPLFVTTCSIIANQICETPFPTRASTFLAKGTLLGGQKCCHIVLFSIVVHV
jgi:hypothetical protein